MARRRKIEIPAIDLECYDALIEELRQHPAFTDNFDWLSLKVSAYENFDHTIKDIDRALKSLERYEWINKDKIATFEGMQILNKSDIAKALGVSRPTVDKWIDAGFFDSCEMRSTLLLKVISCR